MVLTTLNSMIGNIKPQNVFFKGNRNVKFYKMKYFSESILSEIYNEWI